MRGERGEVGRRRRRVAVNRSWSTPWGATTIGAARVRRARAAGRRCTSLTHTSTAARRARGADHRPEEHDLAALVPLGMVEEREVVHGDDARAPARAQRHRVVRAVPHVGPRAASASAAPRACSHASRAGRPAGHLGVHVGAGRERRPAARRRRVAARRWRSDVGVRGEARRQRDGVDAGADRTRRVPPRRRGAPARRRSLRALRPWPGSAGYDRARVAYAVGVALRRELRPGELGRARRPARRRGRRAGRRRRADRSSASVHASTSPGGKSSAGVADDLVDRRALARPRPGAARERLERREPEAFVPRRDAARGRRGGWSASTTGHGCSPSRRTPGRSMPLDAAPARRPDDRRARGSACRRARRRSTASTIVGRSLRGSTVPTVSTYGASTPTRRDRGVDVVVGARERRIDAERRDVHVFGAEAFAEQLVARERRRRDHEVGVPARELRARGDGTRRRAGS